MEVILLQDVKGVGKAGSITLSKHGTNGTPSAFGSMVAMGGQALADALEALGYTDAAQAALLAVGQEAVAAMRRHKQELDTLKEQLSRIGQ